MRCILFGFAFILATSAQASITLVAEPYATFAEAGEPNSRLMALVQQAFERAGIEAQLQVMRPAFAGSGLLSGKIDGRYDSTTLNHDDVRYLYSTSFLPVYLDLASKSTSVQQVRLIEHVQDERIAAENRFANTDVLRQMKSARWSRNPTSFDAFRQLADGRAPYLLVDRLLLTEFNLLLNSVDEEPLLSSAKPMVNTNYRLQLNKTVTNAALVISQFEQVISTMQEDGSFNRLLAVSWFTKDINGDGVADWITSSRVSHVEQMPSNGYALDRTLPSAASLLVIDGQRFGSIEQATEALSKLPISSRDSLLDADIYQDLLRNW